MISSCANKEGVHLLRTLPRLVIWCSVLWQRRYGPCRLFQLLLSTFGNARVLQLLEDVILRGRMVSRLVEVVVCSKHFLARTPVHVRNEFFLSSFFSILATPSLLMNHRKRLGDVPMPGLVNIDINLGSRT